MKLTVANILTREGWLKNHTLQVNQGKIRSIQPATDEELQQLRAGYLVPGYIDTQVNGGGGVLLNQQPTFAGVCQLAQAHLAYGSTGLLPTVITDGADIMQRAADAVAEAITQSHTSVLGIHFEGPFLSVAKKGVHDPSFIRIPTDAEMTTLTRKDLGKVIVTLAPEQVDVTLIKELVSEGVIVSLGHTNGTLAQVNGALAAGATGFTHLFNAMSPLTSRAPGAVGAALADKASFCGLIVDHHHVHPLTAKLAVDLKGPEHIMLVTDAMAHVGTTATRLDFFDTEIIRSGNKLTTPEGTLAGSCLDMHSAMLNTHKDLHVPLANAVHMASASPAAFLGLDHQVGSIAQGMAANVLWLDEALQLASVWLNGQAVALASH